MARRREGDDFFAMMNDLACAGQTPAPARRHPSLFEFVSIPVEIVNDPLTINGLVTPDA
jgi:hypothetical protein